MEFFHFGGFHHLSDAGKSGCGDEFDRYVKQALEESFPPDPYSLASRTVTNLWKDRRFRLFTGPGQSRQGRDDKIKIIGTPKAHDGKEAIVVKRLPGGKVKVKLNQAELRIITVEEQNLEVLPKKWEVNRMNVHGGGTLENDNEFCFVGRQLVSLEWIDPAAPEIELDRGTRQVTCPTCRAAEPTSIAYSDDQDEPSSRRKIVKSLCPVCTENKACRTLQCNHKVCHECWCQWRKLATSDIPSDVSPPHMSQDDLQKERDRSFQRLRVVLPHTLGGTATRASGRRKSTEQDIEHARRESVASIYGIFSALDDAVHNGGQDGLEVFWVTLLTSSAHIFCIENAMNEFVSDLRHVAAVEIVIQVVEGRAEEISNLSETMRSKEDVQTSGKAYVEYLHALCCNRIGELYEESEDFGTAIYWYERSLLHAKKLHEVEKESSDKNVLRFCEERMATQLINLGLAQKRASLYSKALVNYEHARVLCPGSSTQNIDILREEMREWTGNSEQLTPGC